MKSIYIIGGTMGIGKTTVSIELSRQLPANVFLDGDWCWDSHPFIVTEETKSIALSNITHVLNNFIGCTAYENIIFCWVLDQQDTLDMVMSGLKLSGCRVVNVSLMGDEATIRKRIINDPSRKREDIERSIGRIQNFNQVDSRKIYVETKTPEEIATEIIALY